MRKIILCFMMFSFTVVANNDVEQALNDFHQAAANADYDAYMGLLTEDAIYLGTDSTERWTKEDFSAFVKPHFSRGNGWLYRPIQRHLNVIEKGKSYFFDELLENENYGRCRGSGVMIKTAGGWKVQQYNLSIPIPNDMANNVVKTIQNYRRNHNIIEK